MTLNFLVTHSGGFHADELLSSVILTRLFPQADLLRSRDKQLITPSADKIIYDVGGAYDAEAQIFDHHQRPSPLREDGQPFSSFGLIWAHYGRAYLAALQVPEADIDPIHAKFDAKFVLPIDLLDNGAIEPSVAGVLSILTLPEPWTNSSPEDAGHPTLSSHPPPCRWRGSLSKRRSAIWRPARGRKLPPLPRLQPQGPHRS